MTRQAPATGTVRWLKDSPGGAPRFAINGVPYLVRAIRGGYELEKEDGTIYRVMLARPKFWICNCPDATKRRERRCDCKHARALPVAFRSLPF